MGTKYALHSQYVRLITAEEAKLNNLKNKSTPLIVNDALIPPINPERTDLPWTLGSKSQPWKNLYISNKKASDVSTSRSEVLDVYATLTNAATKADLSNLETSLETKFATKTYVDTGDNRIASNTQIGGFKVADPVYIPEYSPSTTTTDETIAVKVDHNGLLVLLDGTETTTPYWDETKTLYDPENPKGSYTGTQFYWVKISEAFPGVYKSEFDNYYTVVYTDSKETVVYEQDIYQRYPAGYVYTQGNYALTDHIWGDIDGNIYDQADLISFVNSSIQTETAYFCGNWDSWDLIPTTTQGFTDAGYNIPGLNNYLVVNEDTSHSHTGSRWRYKYDQKITTKLPYDKSHWQPEYEVNDKPFTAAEKAALASGITATKVATYDAYATNKVGFTDYANMTTAGVVKVDGSSITIDSNGIISASGTGNGNVVAVLEEE